MGISMAATRKGTMTLWRGSTKIKIPARMRRMAMKGLRAVSETPPPNAKCSGTTCYPSDCFKERRRRLISLFKISLLSSDYVVGKS